ncbi:MAG TPA: PhoD-like phosphatase N-terminal domain-containing protein [Thermoanaerobaculia bacterium]|nr:PhoD-like phosphatase N-terminal domain-containing protein [Thermoanaerobaculia bacterium]
MTRREAILAAAALGASLAWRGVFADGSPGRRRERRDLFPQGVASADPEPESVVLWTRRPYGPGEGAKVLLVEIARDPQFRKIVSSNRAAISQENDWTCRVLAAGLAPGKIYWYRFVDDAGNQSRPGRTLTAPAGDDPRVVRFAFVSCQNVTQGASTAYRRMIWEDERAGDGRRLDFVLHLGDFVYEVVWYPEDRPQGMYSRRLREVVRYPQGEKIDGRTARTAAPLAYRVLHRVTPWKPGTAPRLTRSTLEGTPPLGL